MPEPESETNSATQNAVEHHRWVRAAVWFGMLGMLIACLSRVTVIDPDLFHELALMREAFHIGRIPVQDQFAYTPTISPVVHHEWGTGAILYLATVPSRLGGTGLILVEYMLSLFIAIGSYACARRRGASEPVFSLLAPLGIIMAWIGFSTVRAQVFTLAGVVGLQLLLTVEERQRRWWIPVWLLIYVIWLNLHAGFLVGFGLFVLFTFERFLREAIDRKSIWQALGQIKHLLACWVAMVLLVAVNPYGLDYYHYLWRAVPLPRTYITEWSPLWRINAWELLWALVFSQLINLYVFRGIGLRPLYGIAMVIVPAVLAFQHARHLSIYAIVWICCAPAWVEQTAMGQKVIRLWHHRAHWVATFWLILGVLGLAEACRARFWEPQLPTSQIETPYAIPIYPAGAVDYLADNQFQGNLHTPFIVGAYVSWKLYPAVKVCTDGRYEVAYPPGQVEEMEAVYRAAPGWQATLNRYHPDAILIPWWSKIGKLLTDSDADTGNPKWQRVYQDDAFSIYVRRKLVGKLPIVDRKGEHIRGTFP